MPSDDVHPNPERFLDLIRRQQRGKLKIYLGFAAGVGKTYEMLQEGNRLRKQGIDVVIGYVETHGRAETIAQIGELEQVSRRKIEYRGIMLDEMDLDAVLERPADDRPGRRVGPHQRPRQPQSETLPRRRGIAARGHQRHHHAQHPAPGKPARHRRAGDRRSRQGAVARLRGHDGRPDRQRRPFGGRPPRAVAGRKDLSQRADPDGHGQLLRSRRS